jgi:type IV fimbrial biogenesis protein FimT
MKKSSRGFTLPELMVVLALAAAIIGIGVPSFREFERNNRLTVAANDVLGIVINTRAEALRRQATVSMCPSDSPADDDASCSEEAGAGWISFVDINGDCVRDGDDELVNNIVVNDDVDSSLNGNCISYASTGFRIPDAEQPATMHMMFCDERGNVPRQSGSDNSIARGIEVLATGRGAVIRTVAELTAWGDGDNPVACK